MKLKIEKPAAVSGMGQGVIHRQQHQHQHHCYCTQITDTQGGLW